MRLRTDESITVGMSPFAPRKNAAFAERKATLLSPILIVAAVCLPLVWCCAVAALPTPSSAALEAAKPLPTLARDPGEGDSPIFAETKIGTVPAKIGTVPSAKTGTVARECPPRASRNRSRRSIYLPDKQGNLQPVLDFKYEEFVDLYRLKNQLGRRDQPPRYSLQRMSATGTATGNLRRTDGSTPGGRARQRLGANALAARPGAAAGDGSVQGDGQADRAIRRGRRRLRLLDSRQARLAA